MELKSNVASGIFPNNSSIKSSQMNAGTFFISITITAVILLFIRLFWRQIVVIGLIIYYVGVLAILSLLSAIIWASFISETTEGWPWLWLYFFLAYLGIIVIYALIVTDIFEMALKWINDIFHN